MILWKWPWHQGTWILVLVSLLICSVALNKSTSGSGGARGLFVGFHLWNEVGPDYIQDSCLLSVWFSNDLCYFYKKNYLWSKWKVILRKKKICVLLINMPNFYQDKHHHHCESLLSLLLSSLLSLTVHCVPDCALQHVTHIILLNPLNSS